MIAIKIVYMSLLSASWRTAVSRDWPPGEALIINHYLHLTENRNDWTTAYDRRVRPTLDIYFSDRVDSVAHWVTDYFANLNDQVDYTQNSPPGPGPELHEALLGVRKLVFMIRYANIGLLNDIKKALLVGGPINLPDILGGIDDAAVASVPTDYAIVKRAGPRIWVEAYTVEVAVLFSLNKSMLNHLQGVYQSDRLQYYQGMIDRLHQHLSRYLRIQTEFKYIGDMFRLHTHINGLFAAGIHGYGDRRIKGVLEGVANAILSVVAIYGTGRDVANGKDMLSILLENVWEIRRYLKLDRIPFVHLDVFSDLLSGHLRQIVGNIFPHLMMFEWYYQFIPMLDRIRAMRTRRF
jgi:hypothetical protein